MFPRRNKSLTIDQVDYSTIQPVTLDSTNFPYQLIECIRNAVESRNFDAIKNIHDTIKTKHADLIPLSRVIDKIYHTAISQEFSPEEFDKLRQIIPVDINRVITNVYAGMCRPSELTKDPLLNLAVAFNGKVLVDYFLKNGADINLRSHEGETPEQELERRLEKARKETQHSSYDDIPGKEAMLASIKSAKLAARIPVKNVVPAKNAVVEKKVDIHEIDAGLLALANEYVESFDAKRKSPNAVLFQPALPETSPAQQLGSNKSALKK